MRRPNGPAPARPSLYARAARVRCLTEPGGPGEGAAPSVTRPDRRIAPGPIRPGDPGPSGGGRRRAGAATDPIQAARAPAHPGPGPAGWGAPPGPAGAATTRRDAPPALKCSGFLGYACLSPTT